MPNRVLNQYIYTQRFPVFVINADNKMITEGVIGWIIWIYQIIEGTMKRKNNIS